MGTVIDLNLDEIGVIIRDGLDTEGASNILKLLGGPAYSKEFLEGLTLYSELLPLGVYMPDEMWHYWRMIGGKDLLPVVSKTSPSIKMLAFDRK